MSDSVIISNLEEVEANIREACERAGRAREEVTLIAVSKTKPGEMIMEAYEAGMRHFGENKPQEMRDKCAVLPADIHWHMIGNLQRNKVKYVVGHACLIHSVDSVSLAEQIEKESAKQNQVTRILLEVNIAGEESKWGFDPENVRQAAREISSLPHVRVLGLMTSAPMTENPETNRIYFRGLNRLAQALAGEGLLSAEDPDYRTPVLSMGMTGDFEVAVEEGATMVRVGTAIFGKRSS